MPKKPEGANNDPDLEDHDKLWQELKDKGLTESQIQDLIIRMNADMLNQKAKREPEFFYAVYEQKLGRALTDLEKITIKEQLDRHFDDLKKHYGLDDKGNVKKQ
jgi:hypothetical protein